MPNGKGGVYDYFIKDHTETVRVVYTEEREKQGSGLSMEDADPVIRQYEESLFGQIESNGTIAPGNEVVTSRVNKPVSWTANTSAKVSKLSANGQKVGPNVILKVMAGDLISAKTDFHYLQDPGQSPGGTLIAPVISGIINSLNASIVSEGVKGASSTINNGLLADPALANILSQNNASVLNENAPRAYLTILFFDEMFRHVPNGVSGVRVYQAGDHMNPLVFSDFKAPRNGYAYVYLSNESAEPVYFDNLVVTHERGKVIEEDHYYPFGMKIAALSSSKLGSTANGKLLNRSGYQGSYSEFDERTKWNEFELRMYDAQIGRWLQADPYDQYISPYSGLGNKPVMFVDPNGGFSLPYLLATTTLGAGVGYLAAPKDRKMEGALIGAGLALGVGLVTNVILNKVFDDYSDSFNGANGWAWRDNRFDKGFDKFFGRGFDALVSDRLEDIFSNEYHFLGVGYRPKSEWVDIAPNLNLTFDPATNITTSKKVGSFIETTVRYQREFTVNTILSHYGDRFRFSFLGTNVNKDFVSVTRGGQTLYEGVPFARRFSDSYSTKNMLGGELINFNFRIERFQDYTQSRRWDVISQGEEEASVIVTPKIKVLLQVRQRNIRIKNL